MPGRGKRFRRLVMRSFNQIAMSVLATLAATAIYSGLRSAGGSAVPPMADAGPAPAMTTGGKLAARIAGAALPVADEIGPRVPIMSLARWDPPEPSAARIEEPAWLARDTAGPATRHIRPTATARRPEVAPSDRSIALPRLVAPPPAVVVADAGHPLWAGAVTAVSTATSTARSAMGTATATAGAAMRGVVAYGGTLVGHLVP